MEAEGMRIVALESYDTRSHRDWLRGYARASLHDIVPMTMPG